MGIPLGRPRGRYDLAMILCVTLNPCLDKTLTVPAWGPGDSIRGLAVREMVGGKGNNVARALTRLGRTARPVTFLGGPVGAHCEALLRGDDGLDPLVTPTEAPTRIILTARTGETSDQTAFFDPDPAVSASEAAALYNRVEGALTEGGITAVSLSGSSPSDATHGLYAELISLARARGVPVLIDSYGAALDAIWGFWPDVIQLNRREAAAHLRRPQAEDSDVFDLLARWARHGVECGVVTDGPRPVLSLDRGRYYRVVPPPVEPVNPIGSGDCFLAGLIDARLSSLDPELALRHALACAVANALVWDAGGIDPGRVRELEEAVEVECLPR